MFQTLIQNIRKFVEFDVSWYLLTVQNAKQNINHESHGEICIMLCDVSRSHVSYIVTSLFGNFIIQYESHTPRLHGTMLIAPVRDHKDDSLDLILHI